jgi:hypothetical protein
MPVNGLMRPDRVNQRGIRTFPPFCGFGQTTSGFTGSAAAMGQPIVSSNAKLLCHRA